VSNTSMPTLGSLPKLTGNVQLAALEDESSLMAETLRAMRVRLLSDNSSDGGTTVLVTSSDIGEGKTTVATALGRRLAADGVKVLLIEADFRRPKLGALLNLSTDTYLEQVLAERCPIDEAIQVDAATGLHCLIASGRTPGPLPLIAYDSFDALITSARKSYQLIILDSPPVLRVADAILLARWSDVTLFVVRCNRMTVTLLREALRRLPEAQRATVLLALNYVAGHQFDRRDYYGGYTARRGSAMPLLSFGSRE
jgi:polysaccharide biosynthesis transport protein